MTSIVVHYKELALKGKNRPWFVKVLVRNLRAALADLPGEVIRSVMGRIEIEIESASRWDDVRERVRRVFGIANFSFAGRGPHDFDAIASAILADLGDARPESFRVRARRADKRFPLTSPQIEREVGGLIKQATGWRVDLSQPALTINIEMLPTRSTSSPRSRAPADCRPEPAAGSRACCRAGSTHRSRRIA